MIKIMIKNERASREDVNGYGELFGQRLASILYPSSPAKYLPHNPAATAVVGQASSLWLEKAGFQPVVGEDRHDARPTK